MGDIHHRCAVLGKPIGHSLSPALHMAGYREFGLDDWWYTREEVDENDLEGFLDGVDSTWAGLSLTMPLKRKVQRFGLASDTWSSMLEVSNTAIFDWSNVENGRPSLRLYNTDVYGISQAFAHAWAVDVAEFHGEEAAGTMVEGVSGLGASAVILGNGNTALSALAACMQLVVPGRGRIGSVTICARHPDRCGRLMGLAERHGNVAMRCVPLGQAARAMADADVVVSTLPAHGADETAAHLGLCPSFERPIAGSVPPTLLDVAYGFGPTALQQAWGSLGGVSMGGEEMLLYQAAEQFVLMTGQGKNSPGLEAAMRAALQEKL